MKEKKKMSLLAKQSAAGWVFLTPATILIAITDPGYDPDRYHGFLADGAGVYYVTADRIQRESSVE